MDTEIIFLNILLLNASKKVIKFEEIKIKKVEKWKAKQSHKQEMNNKKNNFRVKLKGKYDECKWRRWKAKVDKKWRK